MSSSLATTQLAAVATTDRREWLGSSDIAAVCGISPFKSALDVWLEKTGKPLDRERTAAEEERLYFGTIMEPVILRALSERYGIHAHTTNRRYIHAEKDWARAEIDAEYDDSGATNNIECKNVNAFARKSWGEEGTDEAPDYYVAQSMWGQWVTERDHTIAAAFFGGSSLKTYGITRDPDVIDWLATEGDKFWTRNVLADIPPAPRTKEDAARMLAKMPGFRWVPTPEVTRDIAALRELKSRLGSIKKEMDAIESRIIISFAAAETVQGDADGRYSMVDESGRVLASWHQQTRKAYAVAEGSYHVLRIAGLGEWK